METLMEKLRKVFNGLNDISLLIIRLLLAFGFYKPAILKWQDINAIGEWFEGMNYPFPLFNAYLAGITEVLGVVLLAIGFGTRIIAIPLMGIMVVAIFTIHIGNGFDAGDNGMEIPLYYIAMLMVLMSYGAGKFSIENLMAKRTR